MKTILTLLFGLSTLITSAQGITKEYLVGTWERADMPGLTIKFSLNENNELNTEITNAITGGDIKLLLMKINNGILYLNTLNEYRDWWAHHKFTRYDSDGMIVSIKNKEGIFKLIYKRKKL
jgi:hypothetical protein